MDKQEAISSAREAMFNAMAFAISASPAQAEKIRKNSAAAAKEAVTLRKTITSLASKFKVLAVTINAIAKTVNQKSTSDAKVNRIASIIKSQGSAYKLAEELQEEKGSVSATGKQFTSATSSALRGIAGLMLGLTAVLVPSIRKALVGIFENFLLGLGLSEEQIKNIKLVLTGVIAAMGTYFSIVVFNRVVTAFKKLRELAVVTGLLAEVSASANGIDISDFDRPRTYGGDKDKLPPERRREVDELEKKRKEGKDPVREKRLKRVKQLKKLKSIISFGARLLKFTGIGFLTGAAIDAIGGTLIDIATADEDTEINPENVLKIAVNNVVESVTLGAFKGPFKIEKQKPEKVPKVEMGPMIEERTGKEIPTAPIPQQPAQEVKSKSEQVIRQETDAAMLNTGVTIVNVDNSSTNVGINKSAPSSAPLVFSTNVGK